MVLGDAPPEVEARRHHLPRIADDVDEVGLREDAADQGHAEGMQWVLEHEAAVVLELDRPQEAEPRGDPAVAIVGRKAFKRLVRWVGGRIVWEGHGPPRTRQAEVAEREFVFLGAVESHGHVVHGSPFGEQKPQSLAGKLFREDKVARHAALHGRRGNKRRIAGQQLVEERRAAPPVAENHDRVVLDPCRPQTPAPHRPLDAREHLVAEGCGCNADGPVNPRWRDTKPVPGQQPQPGHEAGARPHRKREPPARTHDHPCSRCTPFEGTVAHLVAVGQARRSRGGASSGELVLASPHRKPMLCLAFAYFTPPFGDFL